MPSTQAKTRYQSLSSWRAWIEIIKGVVVTMADGVALLMESVD